MKEENQITLETHNINELYAFKQSLENNLKKLLLSEIRSLRFCYLVTFALSMFSFGLLINFSTIAERWVTAVSLIGIQLLAHITIIELFSDKITKFKTISIIAVITQVIITILILLYTTYYKKYDILAYTPGTVVLFFWNLSRYKLYKLKDTCYSHTFNSIEERINQIHKNT